MTKIVAFPKASEKLLSSEACTDVADFLIFDSEKPLSPKGEATEAALSKSGTPKWAHSLRDWTNQELASIYRVKHLLDVAKIPTELDRGVTDEGEPWCVFCSTDGHVFIHLSRIDGVYWLDSPKLTAPLQGISFDELVQSFIARSEGLDQGAQDGALKVVPLKRNGTVFLHPSVMLAALVWSLYFGSEDLLLLDPSETDPMEPDSEADEISYAPHTAVTAEDLASFDGQTYIGTQHKLDDLTADLSAQSKMAVLLSSVDPVSSKTAGSFSSHVSLSTMLGLGVIAVTCGFALEGQWKTIIGAYIASEKDDQTAYHDVSSARADVPVSLSLTDVLAYLEESFFKLGRAAQEDGSSTESAQSYDAADINILATLSDLLASLAHVNFAMIHPPSLDGGVTYEDLRETEMSLQERTSDSEASDEALEKLVLLDEAGSSEGALLEPVSHDYDLSHIIRDIFQTANFQKIEIDGSSYIFEDTEELDDIKSSGGIGDIYADVQEKDDIPLFDEHVQNFIFSLWQDSEKLKFIVSGNDLILYNVDAYRTDEESILMTWRDTDGSTVSLIGVASDFSGLELV